MTFQLEGGKWRDKHLKMDVHKIWNSAVVNIILTCQKQKNHYHSEFFSLLNFISLQLTFGTRPLKAEQAERKRYISLACIRGVTRRLSQLQHERSGPNNRIRIGNTQDDRSILTGSNIHDLWIGSHGERRAWHTDRLLQRATYDEELSSLRATHEKRLAEATHKNSQNHC